jgi:hypothetical protein
MTIQDIVDRLTSIQRYEQFVGGGCECCGSWVEHESDKYGDWVKSSDIDSLIEQLSLLIEAK